MKLSAHPDAVPSAAIAVAAVVQRTGDTLLFSYSISAPADVIRLPAAAEASRADDLWKTTCFEAFIRGAGEAYVELNFSPSGQWAAYAFDAYRQGMRELQLAEAPRIAVEYELGQLSILASVRLAIELAPAGAPFGLSAVVEQRDGARSYWALAHPGGAPDFHHPDCFVGKLP